MATYTGSDDLQAAEFVDADLSRARFTRSDLSGVVMRGVEMSGADIDAPWLPHGDGLRINGVDVTPYVEAELNSRFPGRADRRAQDPQGLRDNWDTLQRTWATGLDRVAAMPEGTATVSVDGEWSFQQTVQHLIHATDVWFCRGVLELEQPFHPLGLADKSAEEEGLDMSQVRTDPSYADVLDARAERVQMVTDFLATVTPEELDTVRKNPHAPQYPETTRSCIHVILEEEWEHYRFAMRDLDTIEGRS